ncbi:MAG: hypothetical protein D6675_08440 [Gemmatimonadetes bacterium]|nr:MAG: hypothetical protein D6675_08440 [Gemmatimonadota bacterium]
MKQIQSIIRKTLQYIPYRKPLLLNEAVNFEKQCIFIAIPKTGTTSVRSQLAQKGTPLIENPHLNIIQVRDSLYVYLLKQALGHNETFPSKSVPSDTELRLQAKIFLPRFLNLRRYEILGQERYRCMQDVKA